MIRIGTLFKRELSLQLKCQKQLFGRYIASGISFINISIGKNITNEKKAANLFSKSTMSMISSTTSLYHNGSDSNSNSDSHSHTHDHSHQPIPPTETQIKDILKRDFEPVKLEVKDVSGGCGAMFDIYVESAKFKGKSMVAQHKMINQSLQLQIKGMHGLTIKTKAI